MASRILGMGDILTLIDKVSADYDEAKAKELEKKMKKAEFDFNDFLEQMGQMKKLGGLNEIMKMLPGNMGGLSTGKLDDNMVDEGEKAMKQMEAIIYSMTLKERSSPGIINPSRKIRIAKGAGVEVADVNRVMKQFEQSKQMMKQMSSVMGGKGKKFGKGMKFPF
jgi:signal recognition particle subunit SRP54